MKIAEEEEIRRRWRVENVRRRHNYLPFIVELLKSLASKEQLLPVGGV
jgi:ubiquitin carboxyl-terminal hydrolase L5